jgi:rubrerythrin
MPDITGMTDEQLLAAIEQAIAGNPTGITQYTVNGRSVTRMSLADLLKARAEIETRLARRRGGMFAVARPRRPS